ncbi:MAG TPA: orotidine-5'-phosphate decarboxylase [Pyrinomonadaceae bacterium]|jgi:orotidine-5'-phosphate decarboxylase|nr:orotidine-5'-phosphate decarboxylase [Pyrinomonadaceae bacterium]
MNSAKDKLIVALDVATAAGALEIFEALRDQVTTFKIGMQLFTAAGPDIVREIVSRGNRVFLDLKYHDIPNTVAMAAIEATRLGVSMFNIHTSGGSEMMKSAAHAVAEAAAHEGLTKPKVLGVTLLTSIDQQTLNEIGINHPPASVVPRLAALAHSSGLDGVVASAQELNAIREAVADPNFAIVCPGMRSGNDQTDDQRRTMSARDAIRAGADFVVVGRPILNAGDPVKASLQILDELSDAMTNSSQTNRART